MTRTITAPSPKQPDSHAGRYLRRAALPVLAAAALLPATNGPAKPAGSHESAPAQAAEPREPITAGHAKQPGVTYEQFTERADQYPVNLGGEGWIKAPNGVPTQVKVNFQAKPDSQAVWHDVGGGENHSATTDQDGSTSHDEKIEVPVGELADLHRKGDQLRLLVDYTIGSAADPSHQVIPVVYPVQAESLKPPADPQVG